MNGLRGSGVKGVRGPVPVELEERHSPLELGGGAF